MPKGIWKRTKKHKAIYKKAQSSRIFTEEERLESSLRNKGRFIMEDSPKWKGEMVGYRGIHSWVQRNYGKAEKCEVCGTTEKRVCWANRDKQYSRNIEDWFQACDTCHKAYDTNVDYENKYADTISNRTACPC